LADVVVYLDANNNGALDGDEVYTVTDANGNYEFDNLAGGLGDLSVFHVHVIPPPNFTQVSPDAGPISLTDCESHGV
jgi:hypothetical protein